MARILRTLGLMIVAAAVVLLVAGEARLVPESTVDQWLIPALQAGAISLLAGLGLSLLAPFGRMVSRGRCVRCGASIEKSQTYCHEHLMTAVREYQDEVRGGV